MPTKTVNGATLNYSEAGAGEPLVLLHCSSSTSRQWRGLCELLAGDFRTLAIDMYGYGGTSDWSGDTKDLLTDEGDLIRAVTEDCPDGFHLLGHSYGGTICMRLALEFPERLKSLTLIEPTTPWLLDPVADKAAYDEISKTAHKFQSAFEAGDPEPGIEYYFDYWNGPGAWRNAPDDVRAYCIKTAEKTYREFDVILDPSHQVASLSALTMPLLLVRGEVTRAPARRVTEIIHAALPHSALVDIPGAGHMSPITHADEVNEVVVGFLGVCD